GISATTESQQLQNLVAPDWLALAYAAVFGSAIAYGMFFYFAASGNLTSLSSLTFLTTVFDLIFGNILLKEELSTLQWVGVTITLVSVYLINQRETLGKHNNQEASSETNQQLPLEISDKKLKPLKIKLKESQREILQ
ncbi:MAG: DMT family transporter, partial [Cyanobacteria bacterium J06649_11]